MKEEFFLPGRHFKIYYQKLFFQHLTHVRIPNNVTLSTLIKNSLLLFSRFQPVIFLQNLTLLTTKQGNGQHFLTESELVYFCLNS